MSLKVENRIPEMIGVLHRINSLQNRREALREKAQRGMEYVLFLLRRNAPVGKVEPGWATPHGAINHGRPSIRQHGTTLEAGWMQRMEASGYGHNIIIENRAPHAMYVARGTPSHPIFGRPRLAFWWGDYSSSGGAGWGPYLGDDPGPFSFRQVMHPGARANPFVTLSTRQSRPRMLELTKEGAAIAMRPLNQFFGRS